MRKNIVAGNWKMNKTFSEAEELIDQIFLEMEDKSFQCEVVICTPALYLEMATDYAEEGRLKIGAQNASEHEQGAYTGEISAAMLASLDIEYCIIGHSERRKYFHETNQQLAEKTDRLLDYGVKPIFCIGEVLEEREENIHFEVVKKQLEESLFHLNKDEFSNIVLAYEPVWAIGTGKTATPGQAQEMHAFIRSQITEKYGKETADEVSILYGGSCNPKNAKELFSQTDVDGGLIGGASLKSDDFLAIANSF
ncbi:MAG: triose-phosphate isomerase [Bacteroidales bacterium]|nr:triose-phosphate isomerase [Bacteroidales bacterium]